MNLRGVAGPRALCAEQEPAAEGEQGQEGPAYAAESGYTILGAAQVSKGVGRLGIGSFSVEFLCVNTMPCRPLPLPVHFWYNLPP